MFNTGTIYSNFTPLVKSPVIGYRISGEDVLPILKKLTKRNFSKDHSIMKLVELHNIDGTILDKCNVVYFKSPNSFTGEDVCEIFIHGSPLIASQLEQLFKDFNISGLRLAQKGEFSLRSVLNNKYSLKQAKAINLIINNESFSSLEYNKKILFEGDSVSGLAPLREDIVNLFSEITASIDFVDDEEFNFKKIIKESRNFFNNCNKLLHKNRTKIEQKNICRVMIIGPVNVGKSSYNSKNIKINHNLNREDLIKRIKLPRIYNKYIDHKNHKLEFNSNEIEFLEKILEYERDILNEKDILIIAQLMRNILDDFSYEFGYINNEDVYDRVFSNFCIGK